MKIIKNNINVPLYLKKIIEDFPKLTSGRKSYKEHEVRIQRSIELVNKYIRKKK
jgi:hypothetical protein